jgi:mannose-6-phosphate isomerase-like protein (cupin superfamily)
MQLRKVFYGAALSICLSAIFSAQDAVKVDPKHYTVVSENDQVRILKAHYGPHEKSVMHSHPNTVAVFLTDAKGQFTFPGGKTQAFDVKAGDTEYSKAGAHLPENTGDKAMEVVIVELKGKAAKPAAATMEKKKAEKKQ